MKGIVSITAGMAIMLLMPAAAAQNFEPQPGHWEISIKMQRAGQQPRDSKSAHCITPQMAKNPRQAFLQDENLKRAECKKDFKRNGPTFSWTFQCSGQNAMKGSGSVTFKSPQQYSGSALMEGNAGGQPIKVTTQMEGRRTGECRR